MKKVTLAVLTIYSRRFLLAPVSRLLFLALLFNVSLTATPLRMDYQVMPLGGGLFDYEFDLILDNNDSSWVSGQNFNWIIFGDQPSSPTNLTSFIADTSDLPIGPFTFFTTTSGGHNGPTLIVQIPDIITTGWFPTALGQSLSWSGTSTANLPQGQLLWSNLFGTGVHADFEVANLTTVLPVPEPATSVLLLSGLLVMGGLAKRKRDREKRRSSRL